MRESPNQQVVNERGAMAAQARLLIAGVGVYRFDLDSINLGKHILNRQDLESEYVALVRYSHRHHACQLREMRRATVCAGGVRILRRTHCASPLEMRALRLLL